VWTLSLVFPENARSSEIKRRDFFRAERLGEEVVVPVMESVGGPDQERSGV
jgi:hypothetical protein